MFQLILYTATLFIVTFNFVTWARENKQIQQSNLREEANRDRSNDWERHRG